MTRSVTQKLYQVSVNAGNEIKAKEISSEGLEESNATKNPGLGTYLMLGVLILASIVGMLLLCYKCDHPASFPHIADLPLERIILLASRSDIH